MRIIWAFLALLNLFIAMRFQSQADVVLATKFNWSGEVIQTMSGPQYSRFIMSLSILVNIVVTLLYVYSHQSRFFKYSRFPGRRYWKTTPDRRLEALGKFQKLFLSVGLLFNIEMILSQIFIFKMNFSREQMTSLIILGYYASVCLAVLLPVIYFFKAFRPPK